MAQENENLENTIITTPISDKDKIDILVDIAFGTIEYTVDDKKKINTIITKAGLIDTYKKPDEDTTLSHLNELYSTDKNKFEELFKAVFYSINPANYQQTLIERAEGTTDKYIISTLVSPEGSGIVTGGGKYDEGDSVILTATANEGYEFVKWNDENTDNPRTITATEDATYTANFKKVYTITAASNDNNWGTVTGGGTYDENSNVTLEATAKTGYIFVNWTKNGEEVSTSAEYSFNAAKDATYTANFAILMTITTYKGTEAGDATASNEVGTFTAKINNETITFEPTENTGEYTSILSDIEPNFDPNLAIVITPQPAANYEYISVIDKDSESDIDTEIPPKPITLLTCKDYNNKLGLLFKETSQESDNLKTISWQNSELMAITATINDVECTNGGSYPVGSEVTMTATPITNSKFDSWKDLNNNGAVISNSNPYIFILNDNVNIRVEASLNLLG